MLDKNKKVVIFSILSLLFASLCILSVLKPNAFLPYYITRPLFLVLMIVMYKFTTKKTLKLFIVAQFLIAIGEVIQYYNSDLLDLAIVFYVLGVLVLIKIILSMLTHKLNKIDFFKYLLFYITFFLIVFFLVLDDDINKISALFYGVSFIFLATLIFINTLMKMTVGNLLIFAGILVASVSNSIISINVSHIDSDTALFVLATLTSLTTHYLVCLGFIYKEDEK